MNKAIIILTLFFLSCQNPIRKISPSFYHWKSVLAITQKEKAYCDSLHIAKLYLKAFDVDWDDAENKAIPKAIVQIQNKQNLPQDLSLCVFVTSKTFEKIEEDRVGELAEKVHKKLQTIADSLAPAQVNEFQIDCDWTPKTRKNYFLFLAEMKKRIAKKQEISATLRLHQIKFYKKTGVPPVKTGFLMCYNMSDVRNTNTQNSILDIKIMQQYLSNFDTYPLHLALILPTFSWGVLQRQGQVIQLLSDFQPDSTHFTLIAPNLYQVKQSHYYRGVYLYQDDKIKVEEAKQEDLRKAADLLSPLLPKDSLTIAFYHLSEENIQAYPLGKVQEVLQKFIYP